MDLEGQEAEVPFEAGDGMERWAVVTPPAETGVDGPAVLMLHGLATPTPMAGPRVGPGLARELSCRGLRVFRYMPRVNVIPRDEALGVDFEAEIEDAVGAARALAELPGVADGEIYLLGLSLGGLIAPLVSRRVPAVEGISSWGGTARPWADYGLDNLRIQLRFAGRKPAAIERFGGLLARWHELLLHTELSAAEMLATEPSLARVGVAEEGLHERSTSFWRQLVRLDPPSSYQELRCRVLAVRGEADCRAHPEDLGSIGRAAEAAGLEIETVTIPGIDHGLLDAAGPVASFRGEVGELPRCDLVAEVVAGWIRGGAG